MRALLPPILAASMALGAAGAEAGKLYGLVIGIDQYAHIRDLKGAVNDAADIAAALGSMGAEVETLFDEAATRDAIMGEWRRLAGLLGPEDRLVVTYAGHGTNEPEHVAGNEADGRDETLLLSGFAPYGKAAGERILDDEIAALIDLAGPGKTIFVADACHSGTLSREISPALGYRYVSVGKIEADPLPPPPPRTASREGREETALFLGAADDSEKTPEFLIGGRPRGALSYAFAAALRGEADTDGDRVVTKGEIETFVRRTVRNVSQGAQRPQVAPAGESGRAIFALSAAEPPAPAAPPVAPRFVDLPPVTLSHDGGAAADRMFGALPGLRLVPASAPADLRVDLSRGAILSMVGDRIAAIEPKLSPATRDAVRSAADKLRLAAAVDGLASGLDVRFADGDRTYRAGDTVTVDIAGRRGTGLALANIGSDGRIAFLYPRRDAQDPASLPVDRPFRLPLEVVPPFGADHIVAFDSDAPSPALLGLLRSLDGSADLAALWDGLAAMGPQGPRVAVFPFHTLPGHAP